MTDELPTIVAGSRSITDKETVEMAIDVAPFSISKLISGNAKGVDQIAERWANDNDIPVDKFPVTNEDYDEHGKYAPIQRNETMVEHADALIAVWDGKSTGTKHIIEYAEKHNLKVFVHHTKTLTLDQFD